MTRITSYKNFQDALESDQKSKIKTSNDFKNGDLDELSPAVASRTPEEPQNSEIIGIFMICQDVMTCITFYKNFQDASESDQKSNFKTSDDFKSGDLDELSPAVASRRPLDPNEHPKISKMDFNQDKIFKNKVKSRSHRSSSTRLDELIILVRTRRP